MGKRSVTKNWVLKAAATTSKVEIPGSAKKEAGLQHHYCITSIVEKHKIPKRVKESLVINSDQTSSKYVQVGRFTMAPKGAKKVAVAGITNKRNITLTLTVTMDGKALPFQAI